MKSKYDVVILGAGHNGLVAAAYLARAGLSVLLLEKNDYIGGATTSQRVFPDYDARLSRYSYLVSLLPERISRELGLNLEMRSRATASYTPYMREGAADGLMFSNLSPDIGRASMRALTGHDLEYERWREFNKLSRAFAELVWDTMLDPLPGKDELRRRFMQDDLHREAWRSLVEEPLGCALERYLQDDLLRGVIFTDAKVGLFTHPHDPTLLQNRCYLYHTLGNRTGEWKVPVGGMGRVAEELKRVAASHGASMMTDVRLGALDFTNSTRTVEFEVGEQKQTVEARFVLVNFGANVLARLLGRPFQADATNEGAVFKINMLLRRLPRMLALNANPATAFCGTFHIDEGYEQMNTSYRQALDSLLPDKVPCEVYCHTLTDDSILAPELRARGFHAMTLFGLDTPWRLFANDNEKMRHVVQHKCLAGLNQWLAEPIEDCLAVAQNGQPCVEAKSPVDIEEALGHYRGNIFHAALSFPFAETRETIGTWGVETEYPNVFFCGASVRRGGGVSGIPGHSAAMKVLESVQGVSPG